jgi:hypothetical protein
MDGIDDVLRRQKEHFDRVGWSVMAVLPTDEDPGAPYAYTVGLTAHDYPELVIAGLPPHIAHALLNDLAARVWDRAERYAHGQRVSDLIAGYDAVVVDGPATEALHPGAAFVFYGTDRVRLQQIAWPDPDGHFPWEPGYRLAPDAQPLIGRP